MLVPAQSVVHAIECELCLDEDFGFPSLDFYATTWYPVLIQPPLKIIFCSSVSVFLSPTKQNRNRYIT